MTTLSEADMLAGRLSKGLPNLRRWGFRVVQNLQAAKQPYEQQRERALIAACYLLGVEPLAEHFRLESVDEVARALLDDAYAPLDISTATCTGGSDGIAGLAALRRLLATGSIESQEGALQGPL